MFEAGIKPRETALAEAHGKIQLDGRPLTLLSESLLKQPDLQRALLSGMEQEIDESPSEFADSLVDGGVTALSVSEPGGSTNYLYAERAAHAVVDTYRTRVSLLRLSQEVGQRTHLGIQSEIADIWESYPRVFAAVEMTPGIEVRLSREFFDQELQQREDICRWLSELAQGCSVAIVGSRVDIERLADLHSHQLPTEFSEHTKAGRTQEGPADEIASAAVGELSVDGREVRTLRDLAAEPDDVLSYHELRAQQDVSKARISQVLRALEDLDLIRRVGTKNKKRVELLPAGSAFLDRLDAKYGVQVELDASFSEARQVRDRPCNPDLGTGPSPAAGPYRTRYLSTPQHAAAAALTAHGGVVVADEDVTAGLSDEEDAERSHVRWVSYDSDDDEAVVAMRATSALQYMTSFAIGLASPRFIDEALPLSRLEDIELSPEILRGARCIGGLSDEAANNPEDFRDALVEWGEQLETMTTELAHAQYGDRDDHRSSIMQSAHGLAGTMVHLLDAAGITVSREVRLPEHLDDRRLSAIATAMSQSIIIQSRYCNHTLYRAVFESRWHKLKQTPPVPVDASEPLGSYIGGLAIRGKRATRLGYHLHGQLSQWTPRDGAAEIAIDIPITTLGREHFTAAVNRMLEQKQILSTREGITLFRALTGSVHATCDSLHWLEPEEQRRHLRLKEVRVSLATLDEERLLPECAPTVSKVVAALLRTEGELTPTGLAEVAGVSTRSLNRHLGALEAIDLVRRDDDGLRLVLPQNTSEKCLPHPVATPTAAVQDYLFDVALHVVSDTSRLIDSKQPLGTAFQWPLDIELVKRCCPVLAPWTALILRLTDDAAPERGTVRVGPQLDQKSIEQRAKT